MEVRIQKYLSDCGIMSRRKAEAEIKAGKVLINGQPALIGQKIRPNGDAVEYNGKLIEKNTKKVYIMLNKPRGYVTTLSDEKDRRCITDLLTDLEERVYPVGRLDLDSEGLLLLTNDGELANKLMHPSKGIEKVYHVKIKEAVTPEQLMTLNSSMVIDGYTIQPCRVRPLTNNPQKLMFALKEGRNRQIRKMCEQVGLQVARLTRVSIGAISLGGLRVGTWVRLNKEQVDYLKSL